MYSIQSEVYQIFILTLYKNKIKMNLYRLKRLTICLYTTFQEPWKEGRYKVNTYKRVCTLYESHI